MAEQLGVRYLVAISLQHEHDGLRLRAHLLDGLSGRVLWAHNEDVQAADAIKSRSAKGKRIAASVRAGVRQGEPPRRT